MASLPEIFKFARVDIVNNNSVTATESQSLIVRKRGLPAQRWDFDVETIPYSKDEIKSIVAFLNGVSDSLDTIDVQFPILSKSDCADKTTSTLVEVGMKTVSVTNSAGLAVGDFFNFSNHSKAYQVVGVSGSQITFIPGARVEVLSGSTIVFDGCVFSCHLQNEPIQFETNSRGFSSLQFDMVEAL